MGEIMTQMLIRGIFNSPTVLEALVDKPKGLDQIAETKFVMCGGGSSAVPAGDLVSEVTCLTSAIGSTKVHHSSTSSDDRKLDLL
jgi:hypothetical protein